MLAGLVIGWGIVFIYFITCPIRGRCPSSPRSEQRIEPAKQSEAQKLIIEAQGLLKAREDKKALVIFENALTIDPANIDALWAEAEVLRRSYKYRESQVILNEVLKRSPKHIPALISLAYIKYKEDKLNDALKLINQTIKAPNLNKDDLGLCYTMLGTVNGRRAEKGGLFSKIAYGTQIRGYLLKAKQLAPDVAEVRLGLGTFYLLAPAIVGGNNLDEAIKELEYTVKIAPNFATACARLAQAYKKKGLLDKYKFYFDKAKELDPGNEALKQIK